MAGEPSPRFAVPVGQLLHTIRVESELDASGFEIRVFQAPRRNQIVAETFGRRSQPHGTDWLCRHLRENLVTHWLR